MPWERGVPLTCPTCRKSETRVVDSRDDETVVRRRRECLDPRCKHRFTTYERMEVPRLFVVKKDGRREQYSREKILTGLRKACEKRPISEGHMEAVAADVERELFARGESEVPSTMVGEKLMEALRDARSGRVHPLRERLPLVPRYREFPGRAGRLCLPSRTRVAVARSCAFREGEGLPAPAVHERARGRRRCLRRGRRTS